MIKSFITTTFILVAFTLFLSLEVGGKPIFSYLHKVVSPATRYAQTAAMDFFSRSFDSTQDYSRKIFDNSVPKMKDSVKSKLSSQRQFTEAAERITKKEKQELDQLIKNH